MDENSSSSPYAVRLGLWTNWSRGRIFGPTLTLERRHGDLIIGFTAFFIAYVGTRFWRIICLACHHTYSTRDPRYAFHHQRQAILRNSSSAESGLWSLSLLLWAWRHEKLSGLLHSLLVISLAVVCLGGFLIAGGFSSFISSSVGNQVLIDSDDCWYFREQSNLQNEPSKTAWKARAISNAQNYASNCYSSNTSGALSCSSYVSSKLPTAIADLNAPCPLKDSSICKSNSSNIYLDTGHIDSNDHLGLNFPPEDRILFRRVLHCAPLVTVGHHVSNRTASANYTQYNYGDTADINPDQSRSMLDFTYQVQDLDSQYSEIEPHARNYILK
jgi:hypothetical protein